MLNLKNKKIQVEAELSNEEAIERLKELANEFCNPVLFDKTEKSFELLDGELYVMSRGNLLLEQHAEECAERNWEKFSTNMTITRQAKKMDMSLEFATKTVLLGIIGPDEHFSYIDSEQSSGDEPTEEVIMRQSKLRWLINSDDPANIDKVNHLIHHQVSGANNLIDELLQ